MFRKTLVVMFCAVVLVNAGFLSEKETVGETITRNSQEPVFNVNEFKAHLKFLASDLLEGRAPGTRGGELAAAYIAAQFEAMGLEPISAEAGYYQQVPMFGIQTVQDSVRFSLSIGDQAIEYTAVEEVIANSELDQENISVEGDLVFVGYGIDAPEYNWDDYKGLDIAGKILVMLVNDPDLGKTGFGDENLTYYGRWTYKEEIARARGAKGILLLHTLETATYPFAVVQSSWTTERIFIAGTLENPLVFNGWLSQPAVDKALAHIGTSFDELKAKADSKDFQPIELGISLKTGFTQKYRTFESPNVIGILPGRSMADEAVIYSAHYDHLGVGLPDKSGDTIYNGAWDNASGVAALLGLANAYVQNPQPERSVIFAAVTAEESGLLGSDYYSSNPVIPLEKTAIVINSDVFNVYGATDDFGVAIIQYTDAAETVAAIGKSMGMEMEINESDSGGYKFRSDHFPFCARGAVALSIHGGSKIRGMTDEEATAYRERVFGGTYHQPSDEVHPDWRYDGTIQMLNLCYKIGRHYADGAARAMLNPDNPFLPAIRMRQGGN